MTERDPSWKFWAFVWYGLLALMALFSYKFGNYYLTLVTIGMLSLYGIILFSDKTLAGKSHRHNRVLPWFILCIGLALSYTGDRWWFSEPKFDSIAAEKDPFKIPLTIEGIHLGMTPNEILEHLGEPTVNQRYHFGDVSFISTNTARKLASAMGNLAGSRPRISIPDSAEILEILESDPDVSDPDSLNTGQSLAIELLERAKNGQQLRAILVDEPLDKDSIQETLRKLESEELDAENILLVSRQAKTPARALLIEELATGTHWNYAKAELDILFPEGSEATPAFISGRRVSIGESSWSEFGRPISSLNSPGRPLKREFAKLFRDDFYQTYRKDWGDSELRVGTESERIRRLEVWPR